MKLSIAIKKSGKNRKNIKIKLKIIIQSVTSVPYLTHSKKTTGFAPSSTWLKLPYQSCTLIKRRICPCLSKGPCISKAKKTLRVSIFEVYNEGVSSNCCTLCKVRDKT